MLAALMLLSACGGSDSSDSSSNDGGAATSGGENDSAASETTVPEQTTTTTQDPAPALDPPDGFAILGFPDPPSGPAEPPTSASDPEHIAAMFSAIADMVLADQRAIDGVLIESFARSAESEAPELVLSSFASSASLSVDVYGTIDRFATTALDGGLDPEFSSYWQVRSEAANVFIGYNQAAYDLIAEASALDRRGLECVAEFLLDGSASCDDHPEAERINEAFDVLNDSVELPDELDDFDDQVPDFSIDTETLERYSLCNEWQPTIDRLGPETAELFDALVDDSWLDSRFLGRSECRWEADLDEDASWDPEPGQTAFAELYAALAATASTQDYDETTYDNASGDDYRSITVATGQALATTLAAEARRLLPTVVEPKARLGLASIAYGAEYFTWNLDLAAQSPTGYLEPDFVAELVGCDDSSEDGCTDEQIDRLRALYSALSLSLEGAVDWDDAAEDLELCALWKDALGSLAEADRLKAAEQVDSMYVEGPDTYFDRFIGLRECETGIDTGDSATG